MKAMDVVRVLVVLSSMVLVRCGRLGYDTIQSAVVDGLDAGTDATADDASFAGDASTDAADTGVDVFVDPCTDGVRRVGGNCYRFVATAASWGAARTTCAGWGGDLVVLDDVAEETWVVATFAPSSDVWLGITDAAVEGTWLTVAGSPAPHFHWDTNPQNPDGGTNSNCARFYAASSMWRDMSCSSSYAFVCERE